MLVTPKEYVAQLDCFADSFELAEMLMGMADASTNSSETYYLKECALHIEGLFKLARSAPIKYPDPE